VAAALSGFENDCQVRNIKIIDCHLCYLNAAGLIVLKNIILDNYIIRFRPYSFHCLCIKALLRHLVYDFTLTPKPRLIALAPLEES